MAINFDGTDDYLKKDNVNVFDDSSFNSTSYSFSFSCWINPDGRHNGGVFEQYDGSAGDGRLGVFLLNSGRIRMRYHNAYITSSTYHISTSTSTWYHLVGFWEYAERGFYVNGSVSDYTNTNNTGNRSNDHSTSGVDFNIGRAYQSTPGSEYFFNGDVAEFAAWKVKLTEPEISVLAAGFSPQFVRPSESLGYWPLGGAYSDYIDVINQRTVTEESSPAAADHPRIIYPSGGSTFDYAVPVVVEEVAAAERSWFFESMELHIAESGGRRHSAEDNPTAATDKGWYLESLEAGVSPAGQRRK